MQLMHNMTNPNYNDSLIAHNFVPYTSQKLYGGDHQLHVINKYGLDRAIHLDLPLTVSTCRERFNVVGSFNGLLCVVLANRKRRRQNRVYLWNPATGQLKNIHMSIYHNNYQVSLGFCFDDASSDYKVVSIVTDMTRLFISRVEMYSLNQNSWKPIDDHVELKFRLFQSSLLENGKFETYFIYVSDGISGN
ncbi:hypothetical protein POM88_019816 [Heracleum sosnowskyi]|uniref:F-box associated beta-propeller type 1 domain-containing protein n=1 Tax=Heracleum sosnowskyi TaxID=360622 RepID=A0AAD8MQW4_9APIA|nr:hypothetical protein POM88_019816 [Heracleum sosnowskyi]